MRELHNVRTYTIEEILFLYYAHAHYAYGIKMYIEMLLLLALSLIINNKGKLLIITKIKIIECKYIR